MVEPIEDFVEGLLEKLERLKRHDFIAKQQSQYLCKRKEGLVEGEFLVIGDFSENFSFVVQDEAQSFHWNNSMATLHPFVYYFKEDGQVKHDNFVLISDCHTHDTIAVHLFQRELMMRHLSEKFQVLKAIICFSDGCAGQYKNVKNFCNLCMHEHDFGVPAEWHFFATSHGKGPSDGIGGTIKREATKASLQRPYHDQILSALKLFQFVDSHLKGINATFLTAANWYSEEIFCERFQSAKTIAGTQKWHCFKPTSKYSLLVSEYSESELTREVQIVKAGHGDIELSKITGYVAVIYDSEWWVAYVSSIQPGTNEVTISYLHPHGPNPSFVYPEPPEELVVDASDILVHLDPVTVTGRTYTLSKKESQAASMSLHNRLQME